MGVCKFVDDLSKLRKSSKDSVDNAEVFDDFKKYMHITRQIEKDLKCILEQINNGTDKTLVLLCGSAGDGKSHLLSYLKNTDSENLLSDFVIYNDGTESSAPSKTAIDTLNELLDDYSDDKLLEKNPDKNVILAINLGVLNNFIESEYGDRYSRLKHYVLNKKIITSNDGHSLTSDEKHFQSINFSDYHMFNLSKKGINASFINSVIDKIFNNDESNPFFLSYKSNCCSSCVKYKSCPVKHNFEFMNNENCRKFVSEVLVESVIKDKLILTTRELQNFLYDITVPQNFNPLITMDSTDAKNMIEKYLCSLTPSLMFEQKDTTPLVNVIKKYDPMIVRTESTDNQAIDFYVLNDVKNTIKSEFKELPYSDFMVDGQILGKIGTDKIYRSKLFSTIKRCRLFQQGTNVNDIYNHFIRDLYSYNVNDLSSLNRLYSNVENAVKQWCGTDSDDNLCIDSNRFGYELYEEVEFNAYSGNTTMKQFDEELYKFTNYIILEFIDENSIDPISLVIDFGLYELIAKLNNGYIQTSEDRNNHADFLTFIKKMKNSGGFAEKVVVISPDKLKVTFQKKKFGYTYKCK